MPLKPGGGDHLQWYNPNNGEYTKNKSSLDLNVDSISRLNNYNYGIESRENLYFPNYIFHSKDYCEKFVNTFKTQFYSDGESIPFTKCNYLLTYKEKDDKSIFLNSMGFYSKETLLLSLGDSVDFKNAVFNKIDKYGLSISVRTELFSCDKTYRKTVDTIWLVDQNLHARFITMLIRSKKYGN